MDRFCINRETLLDDDKVKTLLNPEKHSVHCLVDVEVCRNSGFEILALLAQKTEDAAYCSAYRIGGDSGFAKTLELARETGSQLAGCTTCSGFGFLEKGFRALFVGTVALKATWSADEPPVIEVSEVLTAGSECPNGLGQTTPPCGTVGTMAPATTTTTTAKATTSSTCTGNGVLIMGYRACCTDAIERML